MHCSSCVPERQGRMGCATGTVSEMPFRAGRYRLDRCPHAVLRDAPAGDHAWIMWGQRWALAKRDGSLSVMLPDPSATALEVVDAVEEEWAAQRQEDAAEQKKRLDALGSGGGHG